MKKALRSFLIQLMLLILPSVSLATESLGESREIEGYLDQFSHIIGLNGNVLITRGDRTVLSKSYGYEDFENNIPFTAESQFCIGSVTKQFTAVALLRLVEQNKLKLEDYIGDLIPEFEKAPWAENVTVEHLLTHTSGIYELSPHERDEATPVKDMKQIIDIFKDKPSISRPGELFLYSNMGYVILGYLIEQLTAKPLKSYLRETFFVPLHMESTHLKTWHQPYAFKTQEGTRALALPYQYNDGGIISPVDKIYNDISFAAGGLISTAADLVTWNRALYGGALISKDLLNRFLTPKSLGYGLGMIIETYADMNMVYKHGGAIDGYHSLLLYLPKQKASVCVLTNVDYYTPHRIEALMDNLCLLLLKDGK